MRDPHDREPVDQATIDGWRANYGLDKRTPADAARYWADRCAGMSPAGAVAALGIALDDLDALRKDAERYRWLVRHASLGFDAAPSWNAVVRLPVLDSDDQTITALVDRAAAIDGAT